MDDVIKGQQVIKSPNCCQQIETKTTPTSIIQEQFYLKHILFPVEKFSIDFTHYLKINKNAFLRRKRKKLICLM